MLDFMRKHASSWFVTIIIGAIVVVFVLWGIGTFRSAQFQKVAQVDGVNIFLPEYHRAYQNLVRSYQERLGKDFNEDVVKSLNLRAQTLNQLIDEILIQQASQRLGLLVTDAELRDYIQKIPAFADERGFNEKRYQQLLARQRIPASDFEAQERQRLLLQKVIGFITAFAKVSEADLQETYRLENEAVRVDYLIVSPGAFLKDQQASPAELEQFYDAHKELFREPEKYQARFILLKFRDFDAKIKPDRQKMEAFYYEHLEDYSQPHVIRVSEILIDTPKQASPADRQRLRQQAETILQQARAGEKFDQLVQKFAKIPGLQMQAKDLGLVKRGQKSADWEAVAFGLKKGEFGLAATPAGYHIVQVMDIQDSQAQPFAAVQAQVEKAWRAHEAVRLAQQQAAELRAEMLKSSFEAVVKQNQLPFQETPLLTARDPIPGLGSQPAFAQAALSLKPQEISKPVTMNDGLALLQVVDRRASVLPPLDQIKDRVVQAVRLEKGRETAAREAKKMLARLHQGESLAKLAAQQGLTVRDSGFFTRPQGFPNHPQARDLTSAAFSLTGSQPYLSEPISLDGQNYLLAFRERRPPNPEKFAQEKEQLLKTFTELKRQMLFSQWLATERQRANIKMYDLPS